VAWRARFDNPTGPLPPHIVKVKVHASSEPIAPLGFGGQEATGWIGDDEIGCSSRKPFPIRMVDGVDLIGVPDAGGAMPKILIDDVAAALFDPDENFTSSATCNADLLHAVVIAASDAVLKGFVIDGSTMTRKTLVPDLDDPGDTDDYRWPGVLADNVLDFTMIDCEVRAWHDQVCIDPLGAANSASVSIMGGSYDDAWPVATDEGHAALWIRGPGSSNVLIDGATFSGSHDAIEFAGESGDVINLWLWNCTFVDNENGVEGVGMGDASVEIDNCLFERNFQKGLQNNGTQSTKGTAAVAFRSEFVDCTIRNSVFRNNTKAILWSSGRADSVLNLGEEGNEGNNSFCLDFCLFPFGNIPDPTYQVCLKQTNPPPPSGPVANPNPILAVGNYWLPGNQGAGLDRLLLVGTIGGAANANDPQPTPGTLCIDPSTMSEHDRIWSYENPATQIVFGFDPPTIAPPDTCGACQDPPCP